MAVEGVGMTVIRVKLGYANFRVMDQTQGRKIVGGISAVVARCGCGREFTARENGPEQLGVFHALIGGVEVECPACGHSETFTNQALETVVS